MSPRPEGATVTCCGLMSGGLRDLLHTRDRFGALQTPTSYFLSPPFCQPSTLFTHSPRSFEQLPRSCKPLSNEPIALCDTLICPVARRTLGRTLHSASHSLTNDQLHVSRTMALVGLAPSSFNPEPSPIKACVSFTITRLSAHERCINHSNREQSFILFHKGSAIPLKEAPPVSRPYIAHSTHQSICFASLYSPSLFWLLPMRPQSTSTSATSLLSLTSSPMLLL